jgi:putative hydrolase of the HAD superfamily
MPHPRFRLITLDLDDTLWPCEPVIRAAELAVLDWLAPRAPRLTAIHDRQTLREHRAKLMAARPEIAHDLSQVRRLSIANLLTELDYPPEIAEDWAEQAFAVFLEERNRLDPFPDVAPVLRRLVADFRLVSITNGNANPELTPLCGLFHHHINPASAGAAKPNPLVFELAMGLAGASPSECLHVGDEPYDDVDAARRLGIEAIWVNRLGRTWPDDLEPPTLTITDLHQLTAWLDDWSPAPTRADGTGDHHGI